MPNYFIGINLAETELSQSIREAEHRLDSRLEWAYTKSPHITLVFLGNKTSEDLQAISKRLETLVQNYSATEIRVLDLSIWRTYRYIGVLIMEENKVLSDIQFRIVSELTPFLPNKKHNQTFIPHMTIYSSRRKPKKEAVETLQILHKTLKNQTQKIEGIALMYIEPESKLLKIVTPYLFGK